MTNRVRRVLIILILTFIVAAVYIVLHELRQPPQAALETAYRAIAQAELAGGRTYASFRLDEARDALQLAEAEISRENERWLPFWSYRLADSLLLRATSLASLATVDAQEERLVIAREVQKTIAGLQNNLIWWEQNLEGDLGRVDCRSLLASARAFLVHADNLARDGHVEAALDFADSTKHIISDLQKSENRHSEAVEERKSQSIEWIRQATEYTVTNGKRALIVDKSGHRIHVVANGKIESTIPCEVGYNAAYQKRRAGDGATPEGLYKITELRRYSKYYRALLLDYPNRQDRDRFRKNVLAGVLPADAKIGGLIEIHGSGGQNRDWTDGCVAVTDDHMDYLYNIARVGTPVAIIYAWEGAR